MKKIILASTSKYRKELLTRLGINFECHSPNVDEDSYKDLISDPLILAEKLGYEKAKAIHEENKDSIVIGSDQLAECEGTILSKPGTMEKAIDQLSFLNGKTHRLITSYTLFDGETFYTRTNITLLKMRVLSLSQIKNYLIIDSPLDCAGAYKLELSGISLFEQIETTDHSAIIGLPLIDVANLLNEVGVTVPPKN